ncbi:MAG: glycosyltransferase [Bacteroidaceae bacterium]|nr:glycosyltransferase [Bacteroidaceae bacterium]
MKIILITSFTPTSDNFRGPSAMMYHFFKDRPDNCEVKIFTTNWNGVSRELIEKSNKELNTEIIVLKDDLYNYLHRRHTFAELRIKLGIDKYYGQSNYRLTSSVLNEIKAFEPDFIWVYGEDKTTIIKQLVNDYKVLVAGYDCFPLHYNRLLQNPYCFLSQDNYNKYLYEYKVAIHRELALRDMSCKYFDVGIADRNMFEVITGRKDAKFYPHPHYNVYDKTIDFDKEKLSVLISGKLDEYTWSDATKLIYSLCSDRTLQDKYIFTFLGSGWDEYADKLNKSGYEVKNVKWVEIYAEEVKKHDIQIFPISVGSGTKGKVLDALCMGLLCIGSKIAMENIFVKNAHSCYEYKNVNDVIEILKEVYLDKSKSRKIAEQGRALALKWHSPQRIFSIICKDMVDCDEYDGVLEYKEVLRSLDRQNDF